MKAILTRLFPRTLTNTFPGLNVALIGFIVLTLVYAFRSISYLNISTLDAFTAEQGSFALALLNNLGITDIIIRLMNVWGITQLVLTLLFIGIIIRYKSMIPILMILMLLESLLRWFMLRNVAFIQAAGSSRELVLTQIFIFALPLLLFLSLIPKSFSVKN